jgi:hypothetical protein
MAKSAEVAKLRIEFSFPEKVERYLLFLPIVESDHFEWLSKWMKTTE